MSIVQFQESKLTPKMSATNCKRIRTLKITNQDCQKRSLAALVVAQHHTMSFANWQKAHLWNASLVFLSVFRGHRPHRDRFLGPAPLLRD